MDNVVQGQVGNAGYGDSAHLLLTLQMMPLVLISWLKGQSFRPFIAELTNISQSHLRRGKSYVWRESTQKRAIESAVDQGRCAMIKKGWSETEIESRLQSAPSVLVGEPRPYADFIYALEIPGVSELPLAKAFAEEVDKLILRLVATHEADNLVSFKSALCMFDLGVGMSVPITDQYEAALQEDVLRSAANWGELLKSARVFIEDIWLCLFAALDAEHGSTYFGKFRPRPLFLMVAPKMNSEFKLDSLDKVPTRNLVNQPARRLLELSHAMMTWVGGQGWLSKPVGRTALGAALEYDDRTIGKLFDGTRKMNVKLFETFWETMCRNVAKCNPFDAPLPLILATIFWQNSLIAFHPNQKLKSIMLFDEAKYTRFWTWHRQRWANLLKQGTEDWPTWLDD